MGDQQVQRWLVVDAQPVFSVSLLDHCEESLVESQTPVVFFRVLEIECLESAQVPECQSHVEVANGVDVCAVLGPLGPLEAVDSLVDSEPELGVDCGEDLDQLALVLLAEEVFRVGGPGDAVDDVRGGEGGHVEQSLGLLHHDGGADGLGDHLAVG